jgi:hypothetical protein
MDGFVLVKNTNVPSHTLSAYLSGPDKPVIGAAFDFNRDYTLLLRKAANRPAPN